MKGIFNLLPFKIAKKRYLLIILGGILFLILSYWFKNQMGINFSDNISFSKYFPFNYFQRNDLIVPVNGQVLINDSFDAYSIKHNWHEPVMDEKGKVQQDYDLHGVNNTRCLYFNSSSNGAWSYSYDKYIKIKIKDSFSYSLFIKITGHKLIAYAGVDTFDKNRKVIQWYYNKIKVNQTNKWIKIGSEFTIKDNVQYIRFRLSGTGVGEYWFDNIRFEKTN